MESVYLEKCLLEIEKKVGWGDASAWVNSDYLRLSRMISQDTKIYISSSTLKRLYGKQKSPTFYRPQDATKDALAKFSGYQNWDDYVHQEWQKQEDPLASESVHHQAVTEPAVLPAHLRTKRSLRTYQKAMLMVAGLVSIGGGLWLAFPQRTSISNPKEIVIRASVTKGTAPLSSQVFYTIPGVYKDSLFLTDEERKVYLPNQNGSVEWFFKTPNMYAISLWTGKKLLKKELIYAYTQGWVYQIQSNYPIPITERTGTLHLSPAMVEKIGYDPKKELWISFRNFHPYGVSADNCIVKTRIRNAPEEGGLSCYNSLIELIGDRDSYDKSHRVNLMKPSCASYSHAEFGGEIHDGDHKNLSAFGQDLSQWHDVQLTIRNQRVHVLIDGKLAFTTRYAKALGNLMGVIFQFKGCGSVDYLKIYDANEREVFADNF